MTDTGSILAPLQNTSRKARSGVLDADDPKCDLVLEVTGQEGAIDLHVSSKALSLASLVFDKMLSSQFQEGVQQSEGPDRKRISLPEDDGDALLSICLVVHHRLGKLVEVFSPCAVLKIAYVSEKYDFTDTLRHWSTVWLRKSSHDSSVEDLECLLGAASLFDDWEEFSRISFDYVCQQNGSFTHFSFLTEMGIPESTKGTYIQERNISLTDEE